MQCYLWILFVKLLLSLNGDRYTKRKDAVNIFFIMLFSKGCMVNITRQYHSFNGIRFLFLVINVALQVPVF